MLIQSKRVWIADQFIPAQIEIDDNKIVNIYAYNEKEGAYDYGRRRILPGFIDIHCHGAYGFDTNDANEQGLRNWTKKIANEGQKYWGFTLKVLILIWNIRELSRKNI